MLNRLFSRCAMGKHNPSTPKRGRPLNDSGGSISSASKQHKSGKGTLMQMEDTA
ncbi:unnamed protein product, partial [Rotaria sp. Silwood2]